MDHDLFHTHLLVRATIRKPPMHPDQLNDWFCRLVESVGMNILIPPQSVYCDTPGNEGITGIVCIETSHSSIHVWSNRPEPFLQFDLYSCRPFNVDTVLKMLDEFGLVSADYCLMDRNARPMEALAGTYQTLENVD